MKNGILALGVMLLLGVNTQVHASTTVCVFDLLGKSGEAYKVMEEWALTAKTWRADVRLVSYQSEAQAENDFEQGKCDGVYMTSMRARRYNKFAGSVDAIGAVPSYAIAQKAISFALDQRNQRRLTSTVGHQELLLNRLTRVTGVTGVHSSFVLRRVVDRTALPVV